MHKTNISRLRRSGQCLAGRRSAAQMVAATSCTALGTVSDCKRAGAAFGRLPHHSLTTKPETQQLAQQLGECARFGTPKRCRPAGPQHSGGAVQPQHTVPNQNVGCGLGGQARHRPVQLSQLPWKPPVDHRHRSSTAAHADSTSALLRHALQNALCRLKPGCT
jgi:hypothetical protein